MSALAARTLSRGIDAITARPTSTFTPASAASARVIRRARGELLGSWLGNPRGGRGKKAARPERIRASRSTTTYDGQSARAADAFLGRRDDDLWTASFLFFRKPVRARMVFFCYTKAQHTPTSSVSSLSRTTAAPARVAFILSMSAAPRRPSPHRTARRQPRLRSALALDVFVRVDHFPPALFRGGVLGRDPIMLPNPPMSFLSAGFKI